MIMDRHEYKTQNEERDSNRKQKFFWKHFWKWRPVWWETPADKFSFFVAVFTAALAFVALWQLSAMEGQLAEMALDQRPWIHFEGLPQIVSPLELSSPRVASMNVTYTVKNSGKNPARRVRIIDDLIPLASPDKFLVEQATVCTRALAPNAFVPNQLWPFDSEYVLFPGQQFVETKTIVMVGLGEVREWNNPKRAVVHPLLVGCIDYRSLSSDAHHQTGFIFEIRRKVQHANLMWGIDLDEGSAQPADLDLRVSMAGTGPAN